VVRTRLSAPCIAVYLAEMLTDNPKLVEILDRDLIGLLTAVNADGQPQSSPVWFMRDGEDIVVLLKPRHFDWPRSSRIPGCAQPSW
jgi:hypothetical protein